MTKSSDSSDDLSVNEKMPFSMNLKLGLRMFKVSWSVRRSAVCLYLLGGLAEIGGFILSIYATAKIGGILASFISTGNSEGVWYWLAVDVLAGIIIAIGFFTMGYAKRMLYFAFVTWSTRTFLAALCSIDLADFYDKDIRNIINKVSGGYTWQMSNLSDANLDLIYGILRFLAITLLVAQITWWIVPLIAIFLIPSLIAESKMAKLQWFVWDAKGDQRHIFWGLDWIIKQAKGQMEIRSTQANGYLLGRVSKLNKEFYQDQESKYKHASKLLVPTKVIEVAGTTIGSIVLIRQLLSHTISLERYFFLSGALLRISGALNNIFGTITRMQEGLLFANNYFTLVDRKPRIIDKTNAFSLAKDQTPEIEFEDVSFTYPGQTSPVFNKINLSISPGEHVALVGENGAGKSTLIKLLLRFYLPDSGRILINGHDIKDIAIESWYAQLATLFQDFNHYPFPISENIEVGDSSAKTNKDKLTKAGKFGNVDKMVEGYQYGWETVLDPSFKKGVEPSGGQWQRVALARAFYRNANIIILDEPTSAIDADAEYDIFNSIFEHYKNKSAIIVSHRFSTVRRADRIIVLEDGKIVEQGTHKQLLAEKSIYQNLFSKQAEGYK